MTLQERETTELTRKREKKESVLNHQVTGEAFILGPSQVWKNIVINHFNRICRGDIDLNQLLKIMQDKGVIFTQHEKLVKYPVTECLLYIAKVSNIELVIEEKVK